MENIKAGERTHAARGFSEDVFICLTLKSAIGYILPAKKM